MEMIHINLLPKEFRKKRGSLKVGKIGYYAIGATFGIIVTVVVISMYQMFQLRELEEKITVAEFRTKELEKDIAIVDAITGVKEKIMKRMEAVDRLDQHRTVWVRVLEDITTRLPEFTWLDVFEETDPPKKAVAKAAATDQKGKNGKDEKAEKEEVSMAAISRPVKLSGYCFSLNSLASLMIKMMRSHYFSDIELASVQETAFDKQVAYNYVITATLHYLSDNELKKLLEDEAGANLLASY